MTGEPEKSSTGKTDPACQASRGWVHQAIAKVAADANFRIISELRDAGIRGSVVTLLCDRGDRYARTYYDDDWLSDQGIDVRPHEAALQRFLA
jgi:hypothetical protein